MQWSDQVCQTDWDVYIWFAIAADLACSSGQHGYFIVELAETQAAQNISSKKGEQAHFIRMQLWGDVGSSLFILIC